MLWAYAGLTAVFATAIYALTIAAVASHKIRLDSSGSTTNTDHPPGWIGVLIVPILLIWLSFMAHQVTQLAAGHGRAPPAAEVARVRRRDQPGLVRRGGRARRDEHPGPGSV